MRNEKLTLSVDELAQELGISKPLAYNLIKRNDFPSLRISERRIVIPVDALKLWLNEQAAVGG